MVQGTPTGRHRRVTAVDVRLRRKRGAKAVLVMAMLAPITLLTGGPPSFVDSGTPITRDGGAMPGSERQVIATSDQYLPDSPALPAKSTTRPEHGAGARQPKSAVTSSPTATTTSVSPAVPDSCGSSPHANHVDTDETTSPPTPTRQSSASARTSVAVADDTAEPAPAQPCSMPAPEVATTHAPTVTPTAPIPNTGAGN